MFDNVPRTCSYGTRCLDRIFLKRENGGSPVTYRLRRTENKKNCLKINNHYTIAGQHSLVARLFDH